jgi:glucose-6-phosphate dehydrogenase assembly protein OpcA
MANAVTAPRALTATVIAVSDARRLAETAAALAALRGRSAVRTILISLGSNPQPAVDARPDSVSIEDLVPRYLNNAVASLRLSSLPSIAWWRGVDVAVLPDLAGLVDRLVLDAEDPTQTWAAVPGIVPLTVVSDLRWTRLTRWRNLMAQFFDVPAVRSSIETFATLDIAAGDMYTARLFAGWMKSRLPGGDRIVVTFSDAGGAVPMQSVALGGSSHRLVLELAGHAGCIRTLIETGGRTTASRVGPVGDQAPESLMADELRVPARDLAFEAALQAAMELS